LLSALYAVMGNLYANKGDMEKARGLYIKAIKHKTKRSAVYLVYAKMLLEEGSVEEALSLLQMGMGFKHGILVDKILFVTIAGAHLIGGDVDDAVKTMLEMKAKYDYINADALTMLGYLYLLKEDYENAMLYTQQAIEDSPSFAVAHGNAGQIYFCLNEIEKAKEAFEKAISLQPEIPGSLYYLGIIAEKENNKELASKCFKMAHYCKISKLNTVTREQVDEKYEQYN